MTKHGMSKGDELNHNAPPWGGGGVRCVRVEEAQGHAVIVLINTPVN